MTSALARLASDTTTRTRMRSHNQAHAPMHDWSLTLAGFDIGCASHPAQETGGDSLDFIPLPGGCLGIAVGDASGHGIAAGGGRHH